MFNSLRSHRLQHSSLPCPSPKSWSLLKLMSIESVMLSNPLNLCHPLLLLPSIFPSISPSNEYSVLISFRIDWFDFLAVQGTLKKSSPAPQFKSINPFVLRLLYGPTFTSVYDYWKSIALTIWTFVGKVMSLLFNTLSSFVKTEQLHFDFSLSCIGEGNRNPLQRSCLENPRDGGA